MIPGTDLHQFDVYNDGYFAHLPLTYVDGVILEIAFPRMPYEQLAEFLKEKCGCYFQGLYYQVPSQDLKRGLVRVSDDRSTSYMFDVEETFGMLTFYLDHLDMNLLEYLSQAITYDMDALVSKKIGHLKKREGVEARNNTTEAVKAKTSTKDKGKEKVSEEASDVVENRRCTVEVGSETEYESDDDSDYQSHKLVDYLSPSEDELIELRNRMKVNRKAKAKAKDKPNEEMNKPNEENNMPADNVRGETFEEHDIYMNELLKSLKTADKDGITKDPFISVGEKYTSVAQFKECLTYYALANGFSLWHERSGEERVVAKCGQRPPRVSAPEKGKQRKQTKYPCASSDALPKCPWRCYARWMTAEKTFQCISLVDEHTCVRNFNFGALVNYKWITKIFGDKIRANPNIRLCDIVDLVMKKYKYKVSLNQCVNAKKYALTEYEKSVGEHYSLLRSYGKAILDSNPGSTVKLGVTENPDGKTYFDRFYVCFAGLADGWKVGCRKIIALDGCFLKSLNQGEILTAISRDDNNHIYPVAWAVVNVENKDYWTWFLELLEEDLGCSRGNGLTLMSGQHKGLIEAVKDIMPNAEHRQCARHIYENFRKQYLSLEFRQLFWAASKASYPQLFNKIMDKIKSANPNAHKFWHVIPAGGKLFEVRSGSEGFTVDEGKRTCSCRMWQLSGLPCVHATKRVPVRDEGANGTRGGTIRSRGRGGRGGVVGSRGGASGSIGRIVGGSGNAGGSKRKPVSTAETQKRQGKKKVGTSSFAKWFGLQDELEQS
ncbi:multidrug resistance-associated protein 5 [Tanacetum coccineum]